MSHSLCRNLHLKFFLRNGSDLVTTHELVDAAALLDFAGQGSRLDSMVSKVLSHLRDPAILRQLPGRGGSAPASQPSPVPEALVPRF